MAAISAFPINTTSLCDMGGQLVSIIDAQLGSTAWQTSVVSGTVVGSNIVLTNSDGSTVTIDASTITGGAVDTVVVSGQFVGTDLILTRNDGTTVTIDATTVTQPDVFLQSASVLRLDQGSTLLADTAALSMVMSNGASISVDASPLLDVGMGIGVPAATAATQNLWVDTSTGKLYYKNTIAGVMLYQQVQNV